MRARYLPYPLTRRFSSLVTDYLAAKSSLDGFYNFRPDAEGLSKAIEARAAFPVDRETLVTVLQQQYEGLPDAEETLKNVALLRDAQTYSVCTAHQPNLATGYLYFVYKIIHAIRLTQELKQAHPHLNFVPVYYMGSEDADLDELGTFRFRERRFVWDAAGQQGAVGRMNTASLKPLLEELFRLLGPPGVHEKALRAMLQEAYLGQPTIAAATRYLVHALFGRYGLIVLDADDAGLKRNFLSVMQEDLTQHAALGLVEAASRRLHEAGYIAQAFPRAINLFYLKDQLRARVERDGEQWKVHGTDIFWTQEELLTELNAHPERFSPNVVLRPLYQESILPNVAFIGGGSELAYWLQLKEVFEKHGVFYPAVLLRQSVMWLRPEQRVLWQKTGLSDAALFLPFDAAIRQWLEAQGGADWKLHKERDDFDALLEELRKRASAIDASLDRSSLAMQARMNRLFDALEGKMLRALKRKNAVAMERIRRLQEQLFPGGGLAERRENFMPYYLELGAAFFDSLMAAMEPLRNEFLIVEEAD